MLAINEVDIKNAVLKFFTVMAENNGSVDEYYHLRRQLIDEIEALKGLDSSAYANALADFCSNVANQLDIIKSQTQGFEEELQLILNIILIIAQRIQDERFGQLLKTRLEMLPYTAQFMPLRKALRKAESLLPESSYFSARESLIKEIKKITMPGNEGEGVAHQKVAAAQAKNVLHELDKLHRLNPKDIHLAAALKVTEALITKPYQHDVDSLSKAVTDAIAVKDNLNNRSGGYIAASALATLIGIAVIGLSVTLALTSFGILAPISVAGAVFGASLIAGFVGLAVGVTAVAATTVTTHRFFYEVQKKPAATEMQNLITHASPVRR